MGCKVADREWVAPREWNRAETVLADPRLHWVDAPYLTAEGWLWLPVPQMDRVPLFNVGKGRTAWPIQLLRLRVR